MGKKNSKEVRKHGKAVVHTNHNSTLSLPVPQYSFTKMHDFITGGI